MNNRYIILLLVSLIFSKELYCQNIVSDRRFSPNVYNSNQIDISKQNVIYKYDYIENLKTSVRKSSLTILQIGKIISKFTDYNLLKKDSLENKFSKKEYLGAEEMNLIFPVLKEIGFKKEILRDSNKDSITFQGKVHSTKYEYKEKIPSLNWKLKKGDKVILDYKVKKATVNYGGRKWIAWYSEDIPINLGPYIFGNLPGLILELYDNEENFHFSAIGIDNKQTEIYKRIEKKIVRTSKKDFFKAERNFHEKPELFVRGTIRGGANFKKIPYNPIEIID